MRSLCTWVPSYVTLKLVNGMQKCTIMNNDQLKSFRLFDVSMVFIEPRDVTGCVEIGHIAFVLVLTLVTLNVPKH